MGYRRKKIQHEILKVLRSHFIEKSNIQGGTAKESNIYMLVSEVGQSIKESPKTTRACLFELYENKLIGANLHSRYGEYFVWNPESQGILESEKLLREYSEDFNKFWITVLQYIFYAVTTIATTTTLLLSLSSKVCR